MDLFWKPDFGGSWNFISNHPIGKQAARLLQLTVEPHAAKRVELPEIYIGKS